MPDVKITVRTEDESTQEVGKIEDAYRDFRGEIDESGKSMVEFMEDADRARKVLEDGEPTLKGYAKLAAEVGDKFEGTQKDIRKWSKALKEASPEMEAFGQELSFILDDLRSGKIDISQAAKAVQDLEKKMAGAGSEAKKLPPNLKNIIKGFIGISTAFAAGRALVGFAKDSIEAAREAGAIAEELDEVEDSWNRLKLAVGEALILNIEASIPGGFSKFLDDTADAISLQNEFNRSFALFADAIRAGRFEILEAITVTDELGNVTQFATKVLDTTTGAVIDQDEAFALLNKELGGATDEAIENAAAINRMKLEYVELTKLTGKSELALDLWVAEAIAAKKAAANLADETKRVEDANISSANAIKENQERLKEFAEIAKQKLAFELTVDVDIVKTISEQISELEFFLAGGGELDNLSNLITDALLRGKITPEQAKAMLGELLAQSLALDIELGKRTVFEAATRLADELGISFEEARDQIEGLQAALRVANNELIDAELTARVLAADLEGMRDFDMAKILAAELKIPLEEALAIVRDIEAADTLMTANDILTTATAAEIGLRIKRGLEEAEGIDLGLPELQDDIDGLDTDVEITGNFEDVNKKIAALIAQLKIMEGPWDIDINTVGGGGGGTGGTDDVGQFGADFTVPPGHPGDSFRLGLTSGEEVKVTPAGAPQKLMKVRGGITVINQGGNLTSGMLEDLEEILG